MGCVTDKPTTVVRYVKQDVPASLLTCDPSPTVPGDGSTQRDVARYILQLHDAGQDCREKLAAISEVIGRI